MTARQARKPRGRTMANRLILVFLVLLALGGLYGAASLGRPVVLTSAPASSAGQLPVTSALLACPAPGSAGLTGGAIAEVSEPAGSGTGQVHLTELDPAKGAQAPATVSISPQPGQLTVTTVKSNPVVPKKLAALPKMAGGVVPTSVGRGGLILSATGADAQGLDVEQLGPTALPTARCQVPGADFWFVGPGSPALHTRLYLMNTDGQPADADVSVQTDSGPRLGAPDAGITVPPHGMVVQNLDKMLHAAKAVALHVTTTTGRVVAAVLETSSPQKPGIWLPAAQAPSTDQMLTGLPVASGTRVLYITVPGNAAARVNITAVTPHGSYQPTGGSGISLLGHLTSGISLPSLSGVSGSIRISSNVPVTAELEISGGPPGAPGAFLAGADFISEQGVVAASPVGPAGSTKLVLSAPGHAATVQISQATPGAALTGQAGQEITIPAKSSRVIKIILPKNAAKPKLIALLLTPVPGSGPVYAARLAIVGQVVQQVLPVISSPTTIRLPYVRSSLVTVLGS